MKYNMLIFALLYLLFMYGCGYVSVKSDDVSPAAMEKSVSASTTESGTSTDNNIFASYTTKYDERSVERAHNIKLAAKKINGTIIKPDETFSYNNAVGPMGKSYGFKKARIFVKGQETEGYGGGVCQVSSTLYNTALMAGLEIIERHPHTRKVYYVPEDKDAATSYGGIDLKFKNNSDHSVIITAHAANGKLTVDIKTYAEAT